MNVRTRTGLMLAALAITLATGSSSADEVRLRGSVRLAEDADAVRLGDIAQLRGEYAQQLANLIILEARDVRGAEELTIQDVRKTLDGHGVRWGHINLSGRRVVVRPPQSPSLVAPKAMSPVSIDGDARRKPAASKRHDSSDPAQPPGTSAAKLVEESSVRGMIARHILAAMPQVEPADLLIEYLTPDSRLLDAANPGTRYEIQPQSSLDSDRVSILIRAWDGDRVSMSESVGLRQYIRVAAPVLVRDIARGERLAASDVLITPTWMPPRQAALTATVVDVIGKMAAISLRAGQTVRHKHVRRQLLVRKGQKVEVNCLVGGVLVTRTAVATEDAWEGARIEFKLERERGTFRATVTGPGQAVLDLSNG